MKSLNKLLLFALIIVTLGFPGCKRDSSEIVINIPILEMVDRGVDQLIQAQASDGSWTYEGVYRVNGEIPIGYRVGGTATSCQALLYAETSLQAAASSALLLGVDFILANLDHPLMQPSTLNSYDVRIWAHAYTLTFLCQLRASSRAGETGQAEAIDLWISRLTETVINEEVPGGGWNYANRREQASFVTAAATQSLLWARSQGEHVPDDVVIRTRNALLSARYPSGAFAYDGNAGSHESSIVLPGSAARSAICESTLYLLGGGSIQSVRTALNTFHSYWDDLEELRKSPGTHEPPYYIAPYYFYFGHFYAGQAIELLPEAERNGERERLRDLIGLTRDPDGTWNDRVFHQSRCYGTAMAVLTLQSHRVPLPPAASF